MPYCSQCGAQVSESDLYCRHCGARQPPAQAAGLSPRTASMLCYIPLMGWMAAIAVLASDRFRQNRTVRFHAFQGLYLFVTWLIVDWVINPALRLIPGSPWPLGKLLSLGLVGVWIFMLIKTSQEQTYSLPVLGELAERSVAES